MHPRRGEEASCVATERSLTSHCTGVLALSCDNRAQHLDGVELVAADATVDQFLNALLSSTKSDFSLARRGGMIARTAAVGQALQEARS